jgi:hypothetical protein
MWLQRPQIDLRLRMRVYCFNTFYQTYLINDTHKRYLWLIPSTWRTLWYSYCSNPTIYTSMHYIQGTHMLTQFSIFSNLEQILTLNIAVLTWSSHHHNLIHIWSFIITTKRILTSEYSVQFIWSVLMQYFLFNVIIKSTSYVLVDDEI